ncbi:hypothetical protein HN695_03465 [Candidatus Woesearchaeota archaeon]|jgi:hypothetical protein|nr:hypothetical protein [Candidatus Woesearchaeota archaeon]MBT5272989.1 hypothetical protein [Candidatus Woesearchaeota archaeon]MBT6040471.1 hypothetical protein [Candidatus Woesearchaeota archaeon]MBT6336480.1 hypothetical protein [Candidatus Woesearchaeota archaeon]MBT7927370.1 hypothetical protein [Candidatus Woesearchaeota archaeon]
MDLTNNESYIKSCLQIAKKILASHGKLDLVNEKSEVINSYENLEHIEEPQDIHVLESITPEQLNRAKKCVLEGKFFSEHAAAGEATRLKLGTKYLINIPKTLSTEKIAKMISEEKDKSVSEEDVINEASCKPEELLSLSVGTRHMLQFAFDITKLAKENNYDVVEVLAKQKMLIILNESTSEKIINEFLKYNFFGFKRENVMFMIQNSYHGITYNEDEAIYNTDSPKRLHNHGQMVMQQTMDDQIFFLDTNEKRKYLKSNEYGNIIKTMEDKLSYNIEDLDFLLGAIDFESLALALTKADEGYGMMMEVVANNSENPQKGGMAAFDKKHGKNVMIEYFQLKGIKNKDIKFLNKNFNHYPRPYDSWQKLKEKGVNMHVTIKHGHLYFQPVQGDINFLVKTAFVQRSVLKPIQSWKSSATTPLAIKYMRKQDKQIGFKEFAKRFVTELN